MTGVPGGSSISRYDAPRTLPGHPIVTACRSDIPRFDIPRLDLPRRGRLIAFVAALLLSPSVSDAQRPSAGTEIRGRIEGADIVRAARRHLGVRYVLGGETPSAFDCSGFVQWVFGEYGIAMPRTAREQAGVGDAPPYDGELQPGDLLFFYGPRGAQHIAIYVGRDSIIHASSTSRRVKLDRLRGRGQTRNWFGQRLIAVRRVLPAEGVFRIASSGPSAASARAASAAPEAP